MSLRRFLTSPSSHTVRSRWDRQYRPRAGGAGNPVEAGPRLAYNPGMPAASTHILERPGSSVAVVECAEGTALPGVSARHILALLEVTGAVLLRGFRTELDEFEAFSRRFCERFHRVAARDRLRDERGDGFTAKAPEANFTLLAHSEGTYQPFKSPDLAFFLCLVAPQSPGGEALVVDGRLFLERLPAGLRSRFETQGVIFEALWEPARWQAEFGIERAADYARVAARHPGLHCAFEGEQMRYRYRRTAIQPDAQGRAVFSNAILAHLPAVRHPRYRDARVYARETNRVCFGDGEELPDQVIHTLIDIQDEVAYAHRLRPGDLLVLDNSRVMHGRRPMEQDCPRVMLTRFGHLHEEMRPRAAAVPA